MAWHVASRSALSASGLSEPLVPPLDLEYARLGTDRTTWWRPQQRIGQIARPTPASSPREPLPQLYAAPVYDSPRSGPTLRDHIFIVRNFSQVRLPEAKMVGHFPLSAMSTPRLALERGLVPPRTPVYDGSVYDSTWHTSVTGYFGPPH